MNHSKNKIPTKIYLSKPSFKHLVQLAQTHRYILNLYYNEDIPNQMPRGLGNFLEAIALNNIIFIDTRPEDLIYIPEPTSASPPRAYFPDWTPYGKEYDNYSLEQHLFNLSQIARDYFVDLGRTHMTCTAARHQPLSEGSLRNSAIEAIGNKFLTPEVDFPTAAPRRWKRASWNQQDYFDYSTGRIQKYDKNEISGKRY